MRAMILAAGRGARLRPLTDETPKPLLRVGGRMLIDWHLTRLAAAGVERVVINTAWLGEQIEAAVGQGGAWGVEVVYSREPEGALETGGGIARALPLLGDGPFWVVNADVWTDYPFERLPRAPAGRAHVVLVPNPAHHPGGDFTLDGQGRVGTPGAPRWTLGGIGAYRPELWQGCVDGAFALGPLLQEAAAQGRVTGEVWDGDWVDVGTPERLEEADRRAAGRGSGAIAAGTGG